MTADRHDIIERGSVPCRVIARRIGAVGSACQTLDKPARHSGVA
jgi:hypothetical protein